MSNLKAGMAKAVITPPVGYRLSGYAMRTKPSTGILDDLYAKALVFDDGSKKLVLLVCDLIGLDKKSVKDIRLKIRKLTGTKEENIMVTAIHTHTGPALSHMDDSWIENLKRQLAGAVYAARKNLKPARIGVGRGECLTGINRRYPKSPGKPYFLYSDPEGVMDTTVMVMKIEEVSGNVMGILFNYACHPVSLGHDELNISKDFAKFSHKILKDAYNEDIVSIFLQGCCGNINPRWIYDKPGLKPAPERVFPKSLEERLKETRRLGYMLGAESLKTAEYITDFTSTVKLKSARKRVKLPVRKGKEPITTEVQVFSIGDHLIIGLPGEIFVEYQIELREKTGIPFTFVSELANDTIGYIPVPEAYKEGGYEPTASDFMPEAGGILVENMLDLIKKMK